MPQSGPIVIPLKRGGAVLKTRHYPVQLGAPPETIKDTMNLSCGVPSVFVTPKNLYFRKKRQTFVEYEFPIYFNTFVNQKKTIICCTAQQRPVIEKLLRYGVFAPDDLDLSADFPPGTPVLDMRKELDYFKVVPFLPNQKFSLENVCELREITPNQPFTLPDNVEVLIDEAANEVRFSQDGQPLDSYPYDQNPRQITMRSELIRAPFEPLNFGVTTLGRGHGFDPDEITAGFFLWINRQGLLIDPPVTAGDFISELGIDPKSIRGIILTHCHSDHDAGVLHSIMIESRLDLITTPTIFKIFVEKYAGLVGLGVEEFKELVNFVPVRVNEPRVILGAHFIFRYNLHSVPALGFEVFYRGKSLNYSGDTLNHPEKIEELYGQGIISHQRKEELLNFVWEHDVVLHESGIPPIHTPLSTFAPLSDAIKKKLYLYHLSFKNLPAETGLQTAPGYKEPSINIDVTESPYEEAYDILDIASKVTLFGGFKWDKAVEFLNIVRKMEVVPGETFIKSGERGDAFYIIATGKAAVLKNGEKIKTFSRGDYIGETALITHEKRNADVVALTPVTLLYLEKHSFLEFIRGTKVEELCRRLARVREAGAIESLNSNWLFSEMTVTQKTAIEALLEIRVYKLGELLCDFSQESNDLLLLQSGRMQLLGQGGETTVFQGGDLIVPFDDFYSDVKTPCRLTALADGTLFTIRREQFTNFLRLNPGVLVLLKTGFTK